MKQTTALALMVISTALYGASGVTAARAADLPKVAESCTNCHGQGGVSKDSAVPTIAGYSDAYISDSLTAYKSKERPCPETKVLDGPDKGKAIDMCRVAEALSDSDVEQIAKYFGSLKFVRAQQSVDPELAKKGAEIHESGCENCHSESGSAASDDSGMLAGQWMPYLKQSIDEFKSGKRPMGKKMKTKIDALQPADIDALVNYYGSFK